MTRGHWQPILLFLFDDMKRLSSDKILKDGKNGLLAAPEIESVYRAMKHMAENADFCKATGRINLEDVEQFSWKQLSKKYLTMYESLIHD